MTRTVLRVVFRDYSLSTPAAYSTFTGKDGAAYGKLDFSKYMEQFISDRFVDFEIKVDKADGLKNSCQRSDGQEIFTSYRWNT